MQNVLESTNLSNNYFDSVFEVEPDGPLPEFLEKQYNKLLIDSCLSEEESQNDHLTETKQIAGSR